MCVSSSRGRGRGGGGGGMSCAVAALGWCWPSTVPMHSTLGAQDKVTKLHGTISCK